MSAKLPAWLKPPRYEDAQKDHTAKVFHIILLGSLSLSLILTIPTTIIIQRWPVLMVSALLLTVQAAALFLLSQKWVPLNTLVWAFLISAWAVLVITVWFSGQLHSPAIMAFFNLILVAGLLHGGRAAAAATITSILVHLFFLFLEQNDLQPPLQLFLPAWTIWASHATNLGMAAILLYLITNTLNQTIQKTRSDLIERQQTAEALRISEERFRQVFEHGPMGMHLVDADLKLIDANQALCDMLGYTREELLERPLNDIIQQEDAQSQIALARQMQDGEIASYQIERRYIGKGGKVVWTNLTTSVIRDRHNAPLYGIGIAENITERRAVEEQLRQNDRLAAVGQLAAGVAHDFNNIMSSIILYTDLLKRSTELTPKTRQRLEVIAQQSQRAVDLVQQILDFSRRSPLEPIPIDLLAPIKELVKLLERTLPEDITLQLEYEAGWDYGVQADPTRIQQVFMNLAVNARDAMPQGGNLHFKLARFTGPLTANTIQTNYTKGEWIKISVSDTGLGIDPTIRPYLFDPFFTTKAPGKGTGLGLSQVYGIIKQHKGYLDVNSAVGQGTTFTIYLPAITPMQLDHLAEDTSGLLMGHGETILVVEDDENTREVIVSSLQELNYQVLTAINGQEALAVFAAHESEIAIVLSDIIMPEMDGVTLLRTLRTAQKSVPFVALSGYFLQDELDDLREHGLNAWLPKPPRLDGLAQVIARTLQ